jgi:hypothetical protein
MAKFLRIDIDRVKPAMIQFSVVLIETYIPLHDFFPFFAGQGQKVIVIADHPPPATYTLHISGRLSVEESTVPAGRATKQVGQWYVCFHRNLLSGLFKLFFENPS